MSMVSTLFAVLEQTLKLWNTKEARKYQDSLLNLKKDWYEEFNKGPYEMSDNALDDIELRLRLLSESIIKASGVKDA